MSDVRYELFFVRGLTGERGYLADVRMHPRMRVSGLTLDEARAAKREIDEQWRPVATTISIVQERGGETCA